MLARKLDDLDRVPHKVVLANCLEPKSLDAERAASHFRIPDEHARRKGLAFDLRPAERVDQEAEHVLLATIQPGLAAYSGLRRLEVGGKVEKHGEQLVVPQPRVADAV